MANLDFENMENIEMLLSQHIDNSVDLKCVICGKILINACQATCGCSLCQHCVDVRVSGGTMFCPGNTGECKTANLLNTVPDHKINRQISQLIVKCPEESCSYESQLKCMDQHLRCCPKKSLECPFHCVGCDRERLSGDGLTEHLQQEGYSHSRILVDMIGQLRNEVAELRQDREIIREKCVRIDAMSAEFELIKVGNTFLEREVENLKIVVNNQANTIALLEMDARSRQQRTGLKNTTSEIEKILGDKDENKERQTLPQIKPRLREKTPEWGAALEEIKNHQRDISEQITLVQKCLKWKIDADFVWTINNVTQLKEKSVDIFSEYFQGIVHPFQLQLECHCGNQLWVQLNIYNILCEAAVQWPIEWDVTITITNQACPQIHKTKRNRCLITKPENNEAQNKYPFIFDYTELSTTGLLEGNCFTVQCIVLPRFKDESSLVATSMMSQML